MADAAHAILIKGSRSCTGNFFSDEEVLRSIGVTDLRHYLSDGPYMTLDGEPSEFVELFFRRRSAVSIPTRTTATDAKKPVVRRKRELESTCANSISPLLWFLFRFCLAIRMDADWGRAALNRYAPNESKCRFSKVSRCLLPEKERGVIENSIWMLP